MIEYEKDLNELKEQILKEGNTLVTKKDLLERFCEIDKEYNGKPWNLLQILANINVLIGEEPCEDVISKASVFEIMGNLMSIPYDLDRPINKKDVSDSMGEIRALPSVTPARKKGEWIVEDSGNYNGKYSTCYCSNCKDYYTRAWREMKYCPNCGAEMESEE